MESSEEDEDELDYESVAIPSCDGQGEILAELNAPCKWISACEEPDSDEHEDAKIETGDFPRWWN